MVISNGNGICSRGSSWQQIDTTLPCANADTLPCFEGSSWQQIGATLPCTNAGTLPWFEAAPYYIRKGASAVVYLWERGLEAPRSDEDTSGVSAMGTPMLKSVMALVFPADSGARVTLPGVPDWQTCFRRACAVRPPEQMPGVPPVWPAPGARTGARTGSVVGGVRRHWAAGVVCCAVPWPTKKLRITQNIFLKRHTFKSVKDMRFILSFNRKDKLVAGAALLMLVCEAFNSLPRRTTF
ncbi:hypothetical protein TIFTF001_041360 [Ficus carica]|uniref:Uncharacterized protein n=1 Tax=Ficus carica TaxID=3494 RepID=A0AA87ZN99_FICCA|nr:hypothetical protein TIFTF001_041351 [Ficus carica]GMN29738.1 hypothetical protein TIFTF001_041354 [Ficus carica]GMN29773.1 hypothetical protein TIFTF001_041357 [Ficus carica]GMN29786.1 hypothetical protein TIFTF001_041360 [Ficus carica]